jgi:hypothetical protein
MSRFRFSLSRHRRTKGMKHATVARAANQEPPQLFGHYEHRFRKLLLFDWFHLDLLSKDYTLSQIPSLPSARHARQNEPFCRK